MRLKDTYNSYEKEQMLRSEGIQFMPYIFGDDFNFFRLELKKINSGYYLNSNNKNVSPIFMEYYNSNIPRELVADQEGLQFDNINGKYGLRFNINNFISFTTEPRGLIDEFVIKYYDDNINLIKTVYYYSGDTRFIDREFILTKISNKVSYFEIILDAEGEYDSYYTIDVRDVFYSFIVNDNFKYLGELIRSTYNDKWLKDYNNLITEYSAENDYKKTETITYGKSSTKSDTDTISFTDRKNVSNRTYNNLTENRSNTDIDSAWTFNSINAQDTDKTTSTGNSTTTGGYTDENSKVGSETRTKTVSDTDSGEDVKEIIGYNNNPTDNIQKSLDFRVKNIFYKIIYKDIDSLITLQIY